MIRTGLRALGVLLAAALSTGLAASVGVAAQAGTAAGALGAQHLGRPYWHVFVAYAIAWLLVVGWVVSIARRLARIEKRLEE